MNSIIYHFIACTPPPCFHILTFYYLLFLLPTYVLATFTHTPSKPCPPRSLFPTTKKINKNACPRFFAMHPQQKTGKWGAGGLDGQRSVRANSFPGGAFTLVFPRSPDVCISHHPSLILHGLSRLTHAHTSLLPAHTLCCAQDLPG